MVLKDFSKVVTLLIAGHASMHPGRAQEQVFLRSHQPASTSTEAVLRQMTQAAGVIFAGEVVAVRRPSGFAGSGQDAAEGMVAVDFRVDQAVLGCVAGSVYTLREWAGLWTGGDRYHAGQRLLVFLRTPTPDGLSAPIGGKVGVVPLRGGGHAPGPYDSGTTASVWLVDLRWIQAQAFHGSSSALKPRPVPVRPVVPVRAHPDEAPTRASVVATGPAIAAGLAVTAGAESIDQPIVLIPGSGATTQSLSQVLGLCRGWMKGSDGTL